jgi:hypothetical protein
MTGTRRRSYETGHKPKYLVIVDGTVECDRAIVFATRRASRIGGGLVMLAIVDDADFHHWLGVGQIMREEAEEAAGLLQVLTRRKLFVPATRPNKLRHLSTKTKISLFSCLRHQQNLMDRARWYLCWRIQPALSQCLWLLFLATCRMKTSVHSHDETKAVSLQLAML